MAARQPAALRRDLRERSIVLATRALFDERGVQEAPVEEIARTVGIARGLIYRHFSSKEELYVLTVTDYLAELDDELAAAIVPGGDPAEQLEQWARAYASFCGRYPAFLDCSMSLMHRSARELHEVVSESVWLRLGQGMAACISRVAVVLEAGAQTGAFTIDEPDVMANVLWTQTLGAMHLTRIGIGLRQAAPGMPELFAVSPQQIVEACVCSAMATVQAPARA